MWLRGNPVRRGRRISMTPLIDIVFILLLCFILETNFLSLGELGLSLPREEQGQQARRQALHIQIFTGGRFWYEGQSHELDSLAERLARGAYPRETPVVLSTEDSVVVQEMVDIVDLLREYGLAQVHIVPLEE